MKVNFYTTLRRIVGAKTIEFSLPEGSTLRQLLDEMLRAYPDLRKELLDAQDELHPHVQVFVNGRNAPFMQHGLETPLAPDDEIGIFHAVEGG